MRAMSRVGKGKTGVCGVGECAFVGVCACVCEGGIKNCEGTEKQLTGGTQRSKIKNAHRR